MASGISEGNLEAIEDFLAELRAQGVSESALGNYVKALRSLAAYLGSRHFRKASRRDLVRWASSLEVSESTRALYLTLVRRFYKWLYGSRGYPKAVEWAKPRARRRLPRMLLTREEVEGMAEAASSPRDRAIVLVLYESGVRAGELLSLRVGDVSFDRYGAVIVVSGKTGERRIRLVDSAPALRDWLRYHPRREDPQAPLWTSRAGALGYHGLRKLIKRLAERAGVRKKVTLHLFRHSRMTELAKILREPELRIIAGWSPSSRTPAIYMHLSGADVEEKILKAKGLIAEGEKCPSCGHLNPRQAKYCISCGAKLKPQLKSQHTA